jgi:hypothetical protein
MALLLAGCAPVALDADWRVLVDTAVAVSAADAVRADLDANCPLWTRAALVRYAIVWRGLQAAARHDTSAVTGDCLTRYLQDARGAKP